MVKTLNIETEVLKVHPFETTIGPSPYRLVDFFALVLPSENNQGRNNFHLAPKVERGIGTCSHCGTAIVNCYIIECSNGLRFGVGSDCILKVGLPVKELSKMQRIEKERQRVLRHAKKALKGDKARAELNALIDSHGEILKTIRVSPDKPHNFLSYAQFVSKRSSDGGIVLALKRVKNALGLLDQKLK